MHARIKKFMCHNIFLQFQKIDISCLYSVPWGHFWHIRQISYPFPRDETGFKFVIENNIITEYYKYVKFITKIDILLDGFCYQCKKIEILYMDSYRFF